MSQSRSDGRHFNPKKRRLYSRFRDLPSQVRLFNATVEAIAESHLLICFQLETKNMDDGSELT